MDIVLGPPAIGKSTLCKQIAKLFGLTHLSAGDILRSHYKVGSEERQKIDNGLFVEPEKINKIMYDEFNKHNFNVIVDGYPRSVEQAVFLKDKPINNIIVLYTQNYQMLLDRCLIRHQCASCHTIYFGPTTKLCCNIPTFRRNDDVENVFKKRYDFFHDNIFPILYEIQKPVFFIDGSQSTTAVLDKFCAIKHLDRL